jgi:hypothetical protein
MAMAAILKNLYTSARWFSSAQALKIIRQAKIIIGNRLEKKYPRFPHLHLIFNEQSSG